MLLIKIFLSVSGKKISFRAVGKSTEFSLLNLSICTYIYFIFYLAKSLEITVFLLISDENVTISRILKKVV